MLGRVLGSIVDISLLTINEAVYVLRGNVWRKTQAVQNARALAPIFASPIRHSELFNTEQEAKNNLASQYSIKLLQVMNMIDVPKE
jgi:hypothetical protein